MKREIKDTIKIDKIDKIDGTVIVRTIPSGAIVTVEGEKKITPAIFDVEGRELPYNIEIKMDEYEDYVQRIVIPKESEIRINITLARMK